VDAEDEKLEDLAESVLDGHSVDWTSAESNPDTPDHDVVRKLKILAGIAGLHRSLTNDMPPSERPKVAEEKLESWGRLKILERIGQGSFGDVYRAWDSKLDREVAVKLLHTGGAQPEGATVLKEARLLARVRHPNVATVYDADEIDGRVGLWMEFIRGRNLEQALRERGKLDDREVTRIGIELCRALSAVHDAGLLHRDIKAQNLMQSEDGRLVLMDFGTGRELEVPPGSSVDSAGTPLYLAPEIFAGAQATVRTDIYSTGVLLFHLLTAAYPVRGATIKEVGEAHAAGKRLDLAAKAPGVNRALAAAIGRAIESDPAKRFGSARDMLVALESVRRQREKPRRAALIAAGFALATVLVGAVAWLSRSDSQQAAGTLQALPFQARDWVLVGGFENRTGEKVFDGTLDYALGLELSNSRNVQIVSRERVGDTLRLMKRPPTLPLDATLAREVCLRDGGIRALVTGRVEKLGSKYLVSVELVDPKRGTTLAGFREESAGADGSLVAIRRISDRVRSAIGETLAPADPEAEGLAKVTTKSLRALQLYSRADALMRDGGEAVYFGGANEAHPVAEQLLRQAVAEDPAFASAWMHLAFALANQQKPQAEVLTYAETAMRLVETATEREQYFIRGSYYFFQGQRERAIAAYEALFDLYPDHYWAASNLAHLYDWLNDPRQREKGVQTEARIADSRPKNFFWNYMLVFDYVAAIPDPARAAPYLRRATELITPEVAEVIPMGVSYVNLVPFIESWVKGDLGVASGEIDDVAAKIDPFTGRARDCLAVHVAMAYLTLGRFEAATRISGKVADPVVQNDMLAQIAFLKGDTRALQHHLRNRGDREPRRVSEGFLDTTLLLRARSGVGSMPDPAFYENTVLVDEGTNTLQTVRGEVALAHGHLADAIRELEEAADDSSYGPYIPSVYLRRESLAAALVRKGDVPRAIQVLERKSDRRDSVTRGTTAAFWLRNRLQLAKLYRRVDRVEDAEAVEAELSTLLALADADHPILVELRRRGSAAPRS
jgi:serine/threonine-protein kinase